MTRKDRRNNDSGDAALMALVRVIVARNVDKACRLLAASPGLAAQALGVGASRSSSQPYLFEVIMHYVYAGDTALHVAAAAYEPRIGQALLRHGARPGARNRRGAEPLHYAVDGVPGSHTWNPDAQQAIVRLLLEAGANPNSADNSGVTPLHRAVRTRCAAAVHALLAGGADSRRKNQNGSTPLHLAVQNTGRGGTGSAPAQEQQKEIILLLLQHGARPKDKDTQGKTVVQSAVSGWIRELLQGD
jgi:ankyrin repeat protein